MSATSISLPSIKNFAEDTNSNFASTGVSIGKFESEEQVDSKGNTDHKSVLPNFHDEEEIIETAQFESTVYQRNVHSSSYLVDKIRRELAKIYPLFDEWRSVINSPESVVLIGKINSIIDSFWDRVPREDRTIGSTLSLIQDSISNDAWIVLDDSKIKAIDEVVKFVIENRNENYYIFAQQKFAEANIRTLPQIDYEPVTSD